MGEPRRSFSICCCLRRQKSMGRTSETSGIEDTLLDGPSERRHAHAASVYSRCEIESREREHPAIISSQALLNTVCHMLRRRYRPSVANLARKSAVEERAGAAASTAALVAGAPPPRLRACEGATEGQRAMSQAGLLQTVAKVKRATTHLLILLRSASTSAARAPVVPGVRVPADACSLAMPERSASMRAW